MIARAKYDSDGEFFGLEDSIASLAVRGDLRSQFFLRIYSKENDGYKVKMPMSTNFSFSSPVFKYYKIQYHQGTFDKTDFSRTFFFLLSVIESLRVRNYSAPMNLGEVDNETKKFCEYFIRMRMSLMMPMRKKRLESQFYKCLRKLRIIALEI